MDPNTYVQNVLKTVSSDMPEIRKRLQVLPGLLKMDIEKTISLCSYMDGMKKHIFYGREKPPVESVASPSDEDIHLLHSALGVITEAGEMLEALHRHLYAGEELDRVNLVEELGDVFWYCGLMAHTLGVPFEDIFEKNIEKLKRRYGDNAFSPEKALSRDLDAERKILESK